MVALLKEFRRLKAFKVLVLGDLLLDVYTLGKVERISPEAPVPVLHVESQEYLPGGSGNVALSLRALGAHVICAGRIGDDLHGDQLLKLLELDLLDRQFLFREKGYTTPVKNRCIAENQQLIRIDHETVQPLSKELETKLIASLEELISQVQIIAISDYGKGFLTPQILRRVIQMAKEKGVATIVDPKGADFTKYAGATMIKPNMSEAYIAAKKSLSTSIELVADEIFTHAPTEHLLITRSALGMSLFSPAKSVKHFPVISKEVLDVTGAGDTVLATLCLALANGLEMEQAVQLANTAAGIAIERLGCAQITLSELAERLLRFENESKIFDRDHSYALSKSLNGKNYTLLILPAKEMHFSIQEIKKFLNAHEDPFIVYAQSYEPEDLIIHFLSSLSQVDSILLHGESVQKIMKEIRPQKIYVWKEGCFRALGEETDLLQRLLQRATDHCTT